MSKFIQGAMHRSPYMGIVWADMSGDELDVQSAKLAGQAFCGIAQDIQQPHRGFVCASKTFS